MALIPNIGRLFGPAKKEARDLTEAGMLANPNAELLRVFGIHDSEGKITVTKEKALGVPAVWCAVNFLGGLMASLPLHHYQDSKNGPKKQTGQISELMNSAVNDGMTSFDWRKWGWQRTFIEGRHLSFIEKDESGRPIALFPMAPSRTTIDIERGRKKYEFKNAGGKTTVYDEDEVIDVPFMLKEDGIGHYSPIDKCQEAIRSALASVMYGGKLFANGGLPPFAVTGPFASTKAAEAAADDIAMTAKNAFNSGKPAISLPVGHDIKSLAIDPEKLLLVEFQRFIIEEVARIYQLPPVFLQDLSRGTFSNAEQQDLHLAKHIVTQWATQFESQLNLKFFGRQARSRSRQYLSHNVSGLMRGDFKSRMEGLARGVQMALYTPNEARALEGREALPGGDELLIQGATVPLGKQPGLNVATPAKTPPEDE